jgi:hypothetical protein
MWGFPAVFLKHVEHMTLVSNYSAIVGGTKADIDEDRDIVLGSLRRSPDQFWQEQYDEEGITAVPKLVPFKGLAGSANDFLAAAVYVAQTTNRYNFFMSPIMLACIDFKWNSHVEKLFMKVCFVACVSYCEIYPILRSMTKKHRSLLSVFGSLSK